MREPLIIGGFGAYDSELVARMTTGEAVSPLVRTDGIWMLSDGPVSTWQADGLDGYSWGVHDPSVTPSSLTMAREAAGSAGVVVAKGEVSIHGDHLGAWPVHYAEVGGAIYFSNRLDPVLRACHDLTLDPMTWASLLSLRFVPPGRSLVQQLATLRHGEIISCDTREHRIRHAIDQPALEPSEPTTDRALTHEIGTAVAQNGEVDLCLSGGFDSRLLLACGLSAGARLSCLTTSATVGSDGDATLASAVARAAGASVVVVDQRSDWFDAYVVASERMDYMTSHHAWALDMCSLARSRGRVAMAGMGGGILLNDHLQDVSSDSSGGDASTRVGLVDRLGLDTLGQEWILAPSLTMWRDHIVDDFLAVTSTYARRRDWQALSILTTRTARSIAMLPLRLAGPVVPVSMPYLMPRILSGCLTERIHTRRSDQLHRQLLELVHPALAGLETTGDTAPVEGSSVLPSQRPETLDRIASSIAGDEVALSVLHPRLRRLVVDGDTSELSRLARFTHHERVLHGALLLALFRSAHPQVGGSLT